MEKNYNIGDEVVRSKGDYVVGRTGKIIELDSAKHRVRVDWHGKNKTWVSVNSVELTSIPYEIILPDYSKHPLKRKPRWATYKRKYLTN